MSSYQNKFRADLFTLSRYFRKKKWRKENMANENVNKKKIIVYINSIQFNGKIYESEEGDGR